MRPEQLLATMRAVYDAQEKKIRDLEVENRQLLRRLDEALDDYHALQRQLAPFEQTREA